MGNKYITYSYLIITLVISAWIHIGAKTFVEFLVTMILTFLFFVGIYFCLKDILKGNLGIKIFKGIGIIVCLTLVYVFYIYASFRQFNSYTCKPNLIGQNILTKEVKSYCNFVPWYTKLVSDTK